MVLLLAVDAHEMGNGAVVRALCLGWEEAAWQFSHSPVVADAVTAFALSWTRLVGAGAFGSILVDVTLHTLFLR
jgi:hypothetical protein